MKKKGRIQYDRTGEWLDCEFVISQAPEGWILRILAPYCVTLAVLHTKPQTRQAEPQKIDATLSRKMAQIPTTLAEFAARAMSHSVLAGMMSDIRRAPFMAGFNWSSLDRAQCAHCGGSVTSVTAKYCSNACKQSAYRQRRSRNNRNTGRKAA